MGRVLTISCGSGATAALVRGWGSGSRSRVASAHRACGRRALARPGVGRAPCASRSRCGRRANWHPGAPFPHHARAPRSTRSRRPRDGAARVVLGGEPGRGWFPEARKRPQLPARLHARRHRGFRAAAGRRRRSAAGLQHAAAGQAPSGPARARSRLPCVAEPLVAPFRAAPAHSGGRRQHCAAASASRQPASGGTFPVRPWPTPPAGRSARSRWAWHHCAAQSRSGRTRSGRTCSGRRSSRAGCSW